MEVVEMRGEMTVEEEIAGSIGTVVVDMRE